MQFVHYAIVVGIVLKSASSINGTRDSKAIQFPEEEPGRIKLIFARELWSLGEGGIENVGVGVSDEKTRGISVAITLNFTSREIWSVLVIADCTQRRCVQPYPVIQMHYEHSRAWGNGVDLTQRRHPAFGELEFGPSSNHPYPLRRGSSCSLFFQHPQCIGQRRDTVPAQFQVVVEPAPDRMHRRIVETKDDGSSAPVNYSRLRTPQAPNLVILPHSRYLSPPSPYH